MNYQLIDGIIIVLLTITCLNMFAINLRLKKRIDKLERINNIEVFGSEILK